MIDTIVLPVPVSFMAFSTTLLWFLITGSLSPVTIAMIVPFAGLRKTLASSVILRSGRRRNPNLYRSPMIIKIHRIILQILSSRFFCIITMIKDKYTYYIRKRNKKTKKKIWLWRWLVLLSTDLFHIWVYFKHIV